jgi:hypothetical protein
MLLVQFVVGRPVTQRIGEAEGKGPIIPLGIANVRDGLTRIVTKTANAGSTFQIKLGQTPIAGDLTPNFLRRGV